VDAMPGGGRLLVRAEARDGDRIKPGHCYIAPGGWHMTVTREAAMPTLRLNQDPPENFCRPAVDPLFRTAARVFGSGALGVILTGMGSDGALGCETLARAGGHFIVQDEASSVVWGMPGAAAATGLHAAPPLDTHGRSQGRNPNVELDRDLHSRAYRTAHPRHPPHLGVKSRTLHPSRAPPGIF